MFLGLTTDPSMILITLLVTTVAYLFSSRKELKEELSRCEEELILAKAEIDVLASKLTESKLYNIIFSHTQKTTN